MGTIVSLFDCILIANRGEIACRIIRTAKRLGIRTVAVHSTIDANALHVKQADRAVLIGEAPAAESYLNTAAIIAAAKQAGAEAIHPGYGFLSENAEFARACLAADIVFIGPPAEAMDAMASKSAAKELMSNSAVPVLPGYHGGDQDIDSLRAAAERTGYPLMLKATAGGGGKGMRIVPSADLFESSLESVKRESKASFGDDRVLLERYVEQPRHIEIQVFSDTHGGHLHLFERDCSVQRRHQKVLEEAPAPGLDEATRQRMGDAAVSAARAVDYVGAGTVEFIADTDGSFFFMEMNTRLQVEHPVTEMITGQDLVEWQLRVAAGEPLPCKQSDLSVNGHAIEARLYAEDPANDFLPASGRLDWLQFPSGETNDDKQLRVETGVRSGDEVSVFYDPMIAKLITHGATREDAINKLLTCLGNTAIVGPATNLQYLSFLLNRPEFRTGGVTTRFIEELEKRQHKEDGEENKDNENTIWKDPNATLAIAAATRFHRQLGITSKHKENSQPAIQVKSNESGNSLVGWRLNQVNVSSGFWSLDGVRLRVTTTSSGPSSYQVSIDLDKAEPARFVISLSDTVELKSEAEAHPAASNTRISALVDNKTIAARVVSFENEHVIHPVPHQRTSGAALWPHSSRVTYNGMTSTQSTESDSEGSLRAPMPGKVISVEVKAADTVETGQTLMVVEAMKMEHAIVAPANGTVEEVCYAVGDTVNERATLVRLSEGQEPC